MPVALDRLLDLLFPLPCAACGTLWRCLPETPRPEDRAFCPLCADALLPLESPRCSRCALPFDAGVTNHLCRDCLLTPPPFDTVCCPWQYGGSLSSAILRLKYGDRPWLSRALGHLLLELPLPSGIDVVVPVPLSRRRLVQRGYNQAALLGAVVARQAQLPMRAIALRRRDTGPQVGKGKQERWKTMEAAFALHRPKDVNGRHVLLVDDVVTTTATVRAAAKTLRSGGACAVTVMCLARTPQDAIWNL